MKTYSFVRTAVTLMGMVAASAVIAVPTASADNDKENIQVSASVLRNCIVSSTAAIAFGDYDVNSATDNSKQGRVTVACTKGVTATIGLGSGLNGNRTMNGPTTDKLAYLLAKDTNGADWSDSSTVSYNSTTRTAKDFTVYGKIRAGQDMTAGSYTDTVVATINF